MVQIYNGTSDVVMTGETCYLYCEKRKEGY